MIAAPRNRAPRKVVPGEWLMTDRTATPLMWVMRARTSGVNDSSGTPAATSIAPSASRFSGCILMRK
jgi:hypothetical protein